MSFFFSSDFPKAQKPFSVAVIQSKFNEALTDKLLGYTIKGFQKCGLEKTAIELFEVPGALEIPFAVKKAIETGDFDGIVCLGMVIKGETYHFEIVSRESARAIMDLNLREDIPVINGILTVNTEEQGIQRLEKGLEFASSLVQMMNTNLQLHS